MASLIIRMVLSLETKVGIMAGCGGSYELGCRGSRTGLAQTELLWTELTRAEFVQTKVARTEVAQAGLVWAEVVRTELTQTELV